MAHLPQHVNRAFRRQRPELPVTSRVGVEPVEQLHGVIERPVGGDAKVKQVHRVRRAQTRNHLRFPFEALHRAGRHAAGERRANQLDRRGPRQHAVARAPHFTHAAFTKLFFQPIAAQLRARFTSVPS